jgi:trimeric autotransporter adhesin
VRGLVILICIALICLVLLVFVVMAQTPTAAPAATYQITGMVRTGKTLLPGVTVTVANTLTGQKATVVSALNGSFMITGLPRGRYVVRIEFMGFAPQSYEVLLNPENPSGRVDAELILASREPQQSNQVPAFSQDGAGFQNLSIENTLSALSGGGSEEGGLGNGQENNNDLSSLPMNGAGAEGPTESVSITGAQGRTQDFGNGSEADLQERIQEFRDRAQREGLIGSPGGPGGQARPMGGPGGGPVMIRMRGKFNINEPHGMLYFQDDNSALDARPYSLTGQPSDKATYNQSHFGAFVGGPLNIPKIYHGGTKTFFFAGWNASRGSNPYDAFTTVPTLLERGGDFSGLTYPDGKPVTIFDPTTGQPFLGNMIDPTRINLAAKDLLQFIPLPNLPTAVQNFHYVTTESSGSDAVNLHFVHNFGQTGGPFFFMGPMGGGRFGGGNQKRDNLNFGMNWRRSTSDIVNPFPSLAGGTGTQGLNANAGWVHGVGKITNILRFNYNHNHVSTTNLYSGVENVSGTAGISGISANPFDWGLPGISFNTFGGLNDPTPHRELDQTYTISDTLVWRRGKQFWRFGGDYRRMLQSFRSSRNAEGSFVFTGFATAQYPSGSLQPVPDTGFDFADFLLGLPQQTSLQSGTSSYDFRANSFDLYAQNDWRIRANLSLNLGLRYEYNGPYTEAHNRIVNLDVAPGFKAAAPVMPGATGQFEGAYPASLVNPDRNDFGPRIGIAWKAASRTVIRAGYGINYNLAQYASFIQNFAFQPPFAIASTNISTLANPLTLENGFPSTAPSAVTNNFAVDPNYRLGYVQLWDLDIQNQLAGGFYLNLDYNGSKGTRLDVERAINIPGIQPFIYESSTGNSVFHAGSVRIRKRLAGGLGFGATYIFSKSIDDASSIGGGGTVVIQNPFNISADRGLSSFDQRHKFTGDWIYDLPFGDDHRFAEKGAWSHILDGWQWSGDFNIASGFYFTPRVLGGAVDINRGVSGSLRANTISGQPISLSNPTTGEWFNTAAFCAPSALCLNPNGSSFGDAGRNIIEGPRQFGLDMALNKTISLSEMRALDLRLQATNVFNTAEFTNINTVANSLTFGQVTSAGNMRRITMVARFRF